MIDSEFIQKNKVRLQAEKTRLEGLLSRVAKPEAAAGGFQAKYPEIGSHNDENAAEVTEYEMNIAEEYDLLAKLQKVSAAIRRIDDGIYGVCLRGGEEMAVERLEAVPEAENCTRHEER